MVLLSFMIVFYIIIILIVFTIISKNNKLILYYAKGTNVMIAHKDMKFFKWKNGSFYDILSYSLMLIYIYISYIKYMS